MHCSVWLKQMVTPQQPVHRGRVTALPETCSHLRSEEPQVAELEVGPEVTHVVLPVAARHKLHQVVLRDELSVAVHETPRVLPERRDGGGTLQYRNGETVLDASACMEHEAVSS